MVDITAECLPYEEVVAGRGAGTTKCLQAYIGIGKKAKQFRKSAELIVLTRFIEGQKSTIPLFYSRSSYNYQKIPAKFSYFFIEGPASLQWAKKTSDDRATAAGRQEHTGTNNNDSLFFFSLVVYGEHT